MRRRCLGAWGLAWGLSAPGCFLASGFALPPAWVPRGPSAADLPDAGAVVLEDAVDIRLERLKLPHDRGRRLVAVSDRRRKIKILRPAGLEEAAVALPIDATSTITRVVARSQSASGTISKLSSDRLRAVQRRSPAERAPEVKDLRFTVPDAEVGGVIEYRTLRVTVDPELLPVHVFGDHLPTQHAQLTLTVPRGIHVDIRRGLGEAVVDRPADTSTHGAFGERLTFVEKDLPAAFPEPMMAHPARMGPWLAVAVRRHGDDGPATWNRVARGLASRMQPLEGEVDAGSGSMQAYDAFRRHLHPLLLPGLGLRPRPSADRVWAGEPASAEHAAALLAALWRQAGQVAYPAVATTRAGPPVVDDLPGLYALTQPVVALQVTDALLAHDRCDAEPLAQGSTCGTPAGGFLIVDPTCKLCALGVRPPALGEGRALLAAEDRSGWVEIPPDPPQRHRTLISGHWQLERTGEMAGSLSVDIHGLVALGLRQQAATRPTTAAWDAAVDAAWGGGVPGLALSQRRLTGLGALDAPIQVAAQARLQADARGVEHYRVQARQLAGTSVPAGWRGSRRTTALLDAPRWHETLVTCDLPPGYVARAGPPLKRATPWAEYAGGFAQHGRTLHFSRRLVVRVHAISHADWGAFDEQLATIDAFEAAGIEVFAEDGS